jgi:phenylalanyl-tRNA synthetase alpha chain
MKNKLEQLRNEILDQLAQAKDSDWLRNLELKYLSRKGEFTSILRSLKDMSEEARREVGQLANEIKTELEAKFLETKKNLEAQMAKGNAFDPTLPGLATPRGHLHPITIVRQELEKLFEGLGFTVADGPELESDYYNFEALNIPPHHPARDMQDTFYIDKPGKDGALDLVMRTQTSAAQVRSLQKYGAPLRVIIPGRVFRCEATDVRHEHTFYQLEGLMVDKNINFSHLKGVLETVGRALYGPATQLRLRPKFYPFVEPGTNGEYTCFLCQGKGCRVCKQTGWLEILGCGLVHPNVLKAGGIDPEKYSGFAFGFGLDRLVMLKYGIDDVRLFHGGDLRFLEQF